MFICHLCLYWSQLSRYVPFSEIILSASLSLLLLDHQPQVPWGKGENISCLVLVKDALFPHPLCCTLLHETNTSSVVFPVHTWSGSSVVCGSLQDKLQSILNPTAASRGVA